MRKELCILVLFISAQCALGQFRPDRVCSSSRHTDECNQLQRGNSQVNCVYAQDAIECAQRIRNGTAEFGVFSAENAYHIAAMGWDGLTVIKEVRHNERLREPYDFQSVAIVRADHTGGIDNLRGTDFCHPGLHYERHQRWSERFLKEFERTINPQNCSLDGLSPAEVEAASLAGFFNAACRPGSWSNNPQEDKALKEKYPKLCSLCEDQTSCNYENPLTSSGHTQALECVRKSSNAITYVALQEAQEFFETNADDAANFRYLCRNGTLQEIGTTRPCVWLTQPWPVIISNDIKAISLSQTIGSWLASGSTGWESALRQILTPGSAQIFAVNAIVRLSDYMLPVRPVPIAIDTCPGLRWCTNSYDERQKCDVIRMAALTTGIVPNIVCNDARSDAISCISDVSTNKADFVGIDSNFGYLARNPYNLTSVLFEETETEKYSSVVAVINERDAGKIKSFEDFKGKRACFGEFGGIASIAFINVAKNRGIFKRADCEFGKLLGAYFGESCLPGGKNIFHDPSTSNPDSLCSLCQTQLTDTTTTPVPLRPMAVAVEGEQEGDENAATDGIEGDDVDSQDIPFVPNRAINCAAAPSNRFYGTRGALTCLKEIGEIAVIEHQNLIHHASNMSFNENDFRIMCRNGSLAEYPGFEVDSACFLTTIVDGEIVLRRKSTKSAAIINVLLSLDKYLQNDPDFKMYNIFAGERNLLFEDSALGLVSPDEEKLSQSVQNYIKLFEDVENCIEETGGAQAITINFLLTFTLVLFTALIRP